MTGSDRKPRGFSLGLMPSLMFWKPMEHFFLDVFETILDFFLDNLLL